MKNIPFSSYEIIFNALIADGYDEGQAEEIICDVILDNIEMDNIAKRIHAILEQINLVH